MNLVGAMLYPVMLLLPAAGVVDSDGSADESVFEGSGRSAQEGEEPYFRQERIGSEAGADAMAQEGPMQPTAFRGVAAEAAGQVRVEQRMTIRISPRAARAPSPDMFVNVPDEDFSEQFSERKIGKCIPVASIAGVRPDRDNRLLLYMRDRRIISAELERSCRAGAFYSGFLLSRSADGQLCVDRDTLLSRSGSNCRLTRIRQLVEDDD